MLAPETLNLQRSPPKEKRFKHKDSNELCTNLTKKVSTIGTKLTVVVPGASSSLCFKIQDQLCIDRDYYEARSITNLGSSNFICFIFTTDLVFLFTLNKVF